MGLGPFTMKLVAAAGLVALGFVASGCTSISDVMRPGPEEQPAQPQAYHDLSMPPDLQLPAPGTAVPPSTPAPAIASSEPGQVAAAPATPYGSSASVPEGDVYERYGISKFHPDGTPKTQTELQAELKKAYLAKKQQKNPNYGTVFNIGNIFKDE